jgi:SNF2 family DNA or RNA helicase
MISARVVVRFEPGTKIVGGKTVVDALAERRLLVRRHGFMPAAELATYQAATEGLRFDVKIKQHVATIDKLPGILKRLREASMPTIVAPEIQELLSKHEATVWLDLQAAKERLVLLARDMAAQGKALYPYQNVGVEWLATRHRALLGDEQGTGKSIQTLCALPANAPVLVVCPAVVKGVWIREAALWRSTMSPQSLEGRQSFRFPQPGEMIITNFDILPKCHLDDCEKKTVITCDGCSPLIPEAHLATCKRGTTYCSGCAPLPVPHEGTILVIDEAHKIRNKNSRRGESCRSIASKIRARGGRSWYLTGTPIVNNPEELWSILESCDLAHEAFGSWKEFVRSFSGKVRTTKIWSKSKRQSVLKQIGYEWGTPLEGTVERLQRVMLRRMRKDVLKDLPSKTRRLLPVDIAKASLRELDQLLRGLGGARGLAEILSRKKIPFDMVSTVRSALAKAKIPAMLALVEEYEAAREPLLVFSAHRAPIDLFARRPGWAVITGDTPARDRTKIEEQFQAGKFLGIAGTIAACGEGITLTYAAQEIFVDQEWTPAMNAQAEDRALRHGQKRAVCVDILVANHPLDQRVAEILLAKTAIIEASIDAAREAG